MTFDSWGWVGYKQSLFPLRDSRGKRTSEWAQNHLSVTLKRDARVEPLVYTGRLNLRRISTLQAMLAPSCLFVSLDYPWVERETARSLEAEKPMALHNYWK